MRKLLILTLLFMMLPFTKLQAVGLPAVFSNQMVLQQKSEVPFWGWGKPGEEISITPGWSGQSLKTRVDSRGLWQLKVPTPAAGGPYTIEVAGYNRLELKDVLIGEVWLVSGQSNMEWTPRMGIHNAAAEVAQANYPNIRFFNVAHRSADGPQLDIGGQWVAQTPTTAMDNSAVAYFFARELQQKLGVPIGIINSSWGGTPAEAWTPPQAIADKPVLSQAAAQLSEVPWGPVKPGKIFHAMIAPLVPYQIAGVLWYQGESNTANAPTYSALLSTLIESWREKWGYAFPFYFAQIAPYRYERPLEGVVVRDEQRKTLAVPHTGMVVTSDIGNTEDIHPQNKQDVGRRFAHLALNKLYGRQELAVSGPLYRAMKREGNKVRLYFDYAEGGLVDKGNALQHFLVAGADRRFIPAKARIEGNTILVSAEGIKDPAAVRFAWSNTAEPALFNKAGLPASAFRTDDWEIEW